MFEATSDTGVTVVADATTLGHHPSQSSMGRNP
jgi:hypothetical protein